MPDLALGCADAVESVASIKPATPNCFTSKLEDKSVTIVRYVKTR